jgi:hypothetical protein
MRFSMITQTAPEVERKVSMRKFMARFLRTTCFALVIELPNESADAQEYVIREVMSGLNNPRGLAIGPDGGLYVAEAGSGGNGPEIVLESGAVFRYGATGGLSRLLNGVQERVLAELPSLATQLPIGTSAQGLADITFDGSGTAYGVIGLGANPNQRAGLGAVGADFATLVRLSLGGAGPFERIADLGAYEVANNPDGTTVDSNAFGIALAPGGGFLVADAGANTVLSVTTNGVVSTLDVFPSRPNPLPSAPPTIQAVPTAVAIGPDDAYYIGELTGFPFVPGAANVHRFDPATEETTIAYSGFTNITDLTFDADGNLYVLQMSTNGLASPMGTGAGALIRIDADTGDRTTIASQGLMLPGSVLAAADGTLYVTNRVTSAQGQVLSFTPIPEPSSLLLASVCLSAVGWLRWRR